MKLAVDLHIHTALSPCGDDDMTPNNIIGMCVLKGLDVIAVTDHNTAKNARAVAEVSRLQGGPIVIAGMELETAENVHLVALFPSAEAAETCSAMLYPLIPDIDNKVEIYGHQYLMDVQDRIVGEERKLLVNATMLGIYDAVGLVKKHGGICYPAHIDREANGILGIFGQVPDDLNFPAVEFSSNAVKELQNSYETRYNLIYGSDAHYLENLFEREYFLDAEHASVGAVLRSIAKFKC